MTGKGEEGLGTTCWKTRARLMMTSVRHELNVVIYDDVVNLEN